MLTTGVQGTSAQGLQVQHEPSRLAAEPGVPDLSTDTEQDPGVTPRLHQHPLCPPPAKGTGPCVGAAFGSALVEQGSVSLICCTSHPVRLSHYRSSIDGGICLV